ncbi:hypothetical protein SAMN05216326_12563 [Nitrosomonas marina]|uniref:Uncharacterized protein n=1 Tax=Nitrosomonas marina TaxID=917 RepID=A0A1I0E931_9PROT|nr:hypothetical protein [Nitrosomonas marina]SET41358.1 hypothetical protein SAMN05216326_12563 [Nitrosomonas marina]
MSLYNDVAKSLSQKGAIGSVISGTTNTTNTLGQHAANMMGGGELAQAVSKIGAATATNVVRNAINEHIPIQAHRALNVGGGVVGDILQGDINSAGLRVLDSGLLNDILPGMSAVASQTRYWGRPTPVFGGITPTEALQIYETMKSSRLSKKNLFLIEVSSELMGDWVSPWFNMFATELDYAPYTVSGEKKRIGGAVLDSVQGNEPVELRVTTMDDQYGVLKKWYIDHHYFTASNDGTVGVPAKYAIKFRIVHSFITDASIPYSAYEDIGWFRPSNIEYSLSRREDAMQEIQMTFSQIDTFVSR